MKTWILVAALTCGLAMPALLTVRAADAPAAAGAKTEEADVKVKLADCPKAVQDTINKAAEGGTIGDISKETEDGKTTYEADVTIGGKEYEVKVAEDGTLISKKVDDDDKEEGNKAGKQGENGQKGKDQKGEHEDND